MYFNKQAFYSLTALAIALSLLALVLVPSMPSNAQSQQRAQQREGADHGAAIAHDGTATSVLGSCAGCHTDSAMLPDNHVSTDGMPLAHCRTCHAPRTEMQLPTLLPLDHTHALAGIGCASCHGITNATAPKPMKEPATTVCKSCHGTLENLAATTANTLPTNPHASPHGAPFTECSLCHMQHQPSQNFCASCHDFDFTLP